MPSLVKKQGFKKMRDMTPPKQTVVQKKKRIKKVEKSVPNLARESNTFVFDPNFQNYKNLESYFDNAIISNNLFDKYFSKDYKKTLLDIELLEDKVKGLDVTVMKIRRLAAKYYLKNESEKTNLDNLHISIKEKIAFLNTANTDYRYYFQVDSEVLSAEGNKHNYIVYKPKILEYGKVNLYNDIFCKIRIDDNGLSEYIGTEFNSIYNKLEILKIINKQHKSLSPYKEVDKESGIAYYNEFISVLKKEIRNFFKKSCSAKNEELLELRTDIVNLEKFCRDVHTIQLKHLLTYYFDIAKERNDHDIINKINIILSHLLRMNLTILDELVIA